MCDPLTQDCPTEEPTGPSMKDLIQEEEDAYTSSEVMTANLMVMGSALTATLYFAWSAFAVSSSVVAKSRDVLWEANINSSNWHKTGNMLKDYLGLAVFLTAWVTQLLSMFGMFSDINMMVW